MPPGLIDIDAPELEYCRRADHLSENNQRAFTGSSLRWAESALASTVAVRGVVAKRGLARRTCISARTPHGQMSHEELVCSGLWRARWVLQGGSCALVLVSRGLIRRLGLLHSTDVPGLSRYGQASASLSGACPGHLLRPLVRKNCSSSCSVGYAHKWCICAVLCGPTQPPGWPHDYHFRTCLVPRKGH